MLGWGHRMYGILLLFAWGFAAAAQAQPAAITLACKGTATSSMPDSKPEQISMGIIVNFATRTVQGFGYPGLIDYPVMITAANEVTVAFRGEQKIGPSVSSIKGTIDRVTGDLQMTDHLFDEKQGTIRFETSYALECRPTQRMF